MQPQFCRAYLRWRRLDRYLALGNCTFLRPHILQREKDGDIRLMHFVAHLPITGQREQMFPLQGSITRFITLVPAISGGTHASREKSLVEKTGDRSSAAADSHGLSQPWPSCHILCVPYARCAKPSIACAAARRRGVVVCEPLPCGTATTAASSRPCRNRRGRGSTGTGPRAHAAARDPRRVRALLRAKDHPDTLGIASRRVDQAMRSSPP